MQVLITFEINDGMLKVLKNQQIKSLVKRDSSVGIVIRLRNGRQRNRGSITDMTDILPSSPQRSDLPFAPIQWVPVAFFPSEYTERETMLNINLHLGA
jgi:hypothetical protein